MRVKGEQPWKRPDVQERREREAAMRSMRGRCSQPLTGQCACFRPRTHEGPCACSCTTYSGTVHGAVAVPAGVSGALVTDAPWGFNGPLRREAL